MSAVKMADTARSALHGMKQTSSNKKGDKAALIEPADTDCMSFWVSAPRSKEWEYTIKSTSPPEKLYLSSDENPRVLEPKEEPYRPSVRAEMAHGQFTRELPESIYSAAILMWLSAGHLGLIPFFMRGIPFALIISTVGQAMFAY